MLKNYALLNNSRLKTKQLESQTKKTQSALKHFKEWALYDKTTKDWSMSTEEIIKMLKEIKENEKEEKYKEALYLGTLQPFITYLENKNAEKTATKTTVRQDKNKLNPTTIKGYVSEVRSYFLKNHLVITKEESKLYLRTKKQLKDKKHALTKDEIRLIIKNSVEGRHLLYTILTCSLMRIGEALSLKKKDIEEKNGRLIIHIRANLIKTGKARDTFLTHEAENVLRPHLTKLQDDDFVFKNKGDPNTKLVVKIINEDLIFNRTLQRIGLCTCQLGKTDQCVGKYQNSNRHKITPHSFRSYGISALNRIEYGLGHKIADHGLNQLTAIYDRMTDEELLKKYDQAESKLTIFSSTKIEEETQERLGRIEQIHEETVKDLAQTNKELEKTKKELEELKKRKSMVD